MQSHLIAAIARERAADLRLAAQTSNLTVGRLDDRGHRRHDSPARRRFRNLAAVVPVLCAIGILLGLTGPARALSYQTARFWLTIRGQQTSSWNLPYFIDSQSCYDRHWTKASGHESFSFRGSRVKVLVTRVGALTSWSFGTWTPIGGSDIIRATGSWSAQSDVKGGTLPGPCGGSSSPDPAPLFVCGTHRVSLGMSFDQLAASKHELAISEQTQRGPAMNCPQYGPQFDAGAQQEFTPIAAILPDREIFDRSIGKEIILAHKRFSGSNHPTGRPGTGNTTTTWTMTLTRVR